MKFFNKMIKKFLINQRAFSVFDSLGSVFTIIGAGFIIYDSVLHINANFLFAGTFIAFGQMTKIMNNCWAKNYKMKEEETLLIE